MNVIAHADKPGLSGEIGPTQFTIPGLPESSQKVIYAVSVDAMKGGVSYKRVLTQKDIDDAVSSVSNALYEKAKATLATGVDRTVFSGESYTMTVTSQGSSAVAGADVGSFTLTLAIDVTAVYYDANAVKQYAL